MKINIITGLNNKEIDEIDKIIKSDWIINYPEVEKHPSVMCKDLISDIKYYDNYVDGTNTIINIKTFSGDIINILGALIHKCLINNKDVCIYLKYNDEIIKVDYDEQGYIETNFPIGYFNYNLNNALKECEYD